jgi:hypothetical protein
MSNGTTGADGCYDAMENISKPVPRKATKTAQELEAALNKALQAHPACHGVKVTKLKPLDDIGGLANWDADFEAEPGKTISPDCKRELITRSMACRSVSILPLRVEPARHCGDFRLTSPRSARDTSRSALRQLGLVALPSCSDQNFLARLFAARLTVPSFVLCIASGH